MLVVNGHDIVQVLGGTEEIEGKEVTFPGGWLVVTRLQGWHSPEALAEGRERFQAKAYASSQLLEHFDEAVEALISIEEHVGGAGVEWRGNSRRLERDELNLPAKELKEGSAQGFVTGHVVVLKQVERRQRGKKEWEYGFQAIGYVTVNVGGTNYHVRLTEPGQYPILRGDPTPIADVMSAMYWVMRSNETTAAGAMVGCPFGTLVHLKQEGSDYKLYTPPEPSWTAQPQNHPPA